MRRALALVGFGLACAVPSIAFADGDPASDVLLGQDVFLPYSRVSQSHQRDLYSLTATSRRSGFPIKVALIAAKSDLGVVPALFGRPATYARFLSSELAGVYNGAVLVVMPDGFGLAAQGSARSVAAMKSIAIGSEADRLASAALAAVPKLAAAAGHPLPVGAATSGSASGADSATVKHALEAILVLLGLAALSCAGAFTLRVRRAREAVRR